MVSNTVGIIILKLNIGPFFMYLGLKSVRFSKGNYRTRHCACWNFLVSFLARTDYIG